MKLTIMQMCRMRWSRLNRTNWRSGTSPLGMGPLLARASFRLCGEFRFRGAQLPAHLESPGQPKQRMSATDHERHQEQRGHAPEGVEQERVLFRVVVGSVRQVSGEAPGCARMALLAGGGHVCPAEVRAWIGYRQHVVSAMAVIALCRFRVPKFRDLPVIGLKIGLGNLLVAASACSHHVQPEAVLIRAVDGMSGMAIVAHGKWLAEPAHSLGMDAVLELLLDAVVAPAARVRNVVCVDTRRRIAPGKDLVSGVATGAGSRHCQAVFQ